MSNLRRLGAEHEDRVAEYLLSQSYVILTRRFSTRQGELDIVALDDETLVFVEVKYRRRPARVDSVVGFTKAAKLQAAAEAYCALTGEVNRDRRFDLVIVTDTSLDHYKDCMG